MPSEALFQKTTTFLMGCGPETAIRTPGQLPSSAELRLAPMHPAGNSAFSVLQAKLSLQCERSPVKPCSKAAGVLR